MGFANHRIPASILTNGQGDFTGRMTLLPHSFKQVNLGIIPSHSSPFACFLLYNICISHLIHNQINRYD